MNYSAVVDTECHNLLLYLKQLGNKLPGFFLVQFDHNPIDRLAAVGYFIFILVHSQEQLKNHHWLTDFRRRGRADNILDVIVVVDQELIG